MTDDRSLLEAAARAAGIPFAFHPGTAQPVTFTGSAAFPTFVPWNPLEDDALALRLAVKLRLHVHHDGSCANVELPMGQRTYFTPDFVNEGNDHAAATRRCIVRAAAAIGRAS